MSWDIFGKKKLKGEIKELQEKCENLHTEHKKELKVIYEEREEKFAEYLQKHIQGALNMQKEQTNQLKLSKRKRINNTQEKIMHIYGDIEPKPTYYDELLEIVNKKLHNEISIKTLYVHVAVIRSTGFDMNLKRRKVKKQ